MSDVGTLPSRVDPGARRSRRRRRSLRRLLAVAGAIGLPLAVIVAVALTQLGGPASAPAPPFAATSAEGEQVTYLFVGTRAGDASGQADWLSLLAIDDDGAKPVTILIPTATLTEVPGFGYDSVGKAMALGRVPLQELAVENMLGVSIDHTLVVADSMLKALVDRAGGVEVNVSKALFVPKGNRSVPVFQPGLQRFDGTKAVRYLQHQAETESELDRLGRAKVLWEAMYAGFAGRSGELARIVSGFGASLVTDAPPRDAGAFFAAFAGADARTYRTLPVEVISSGGVEDSFRAEQDDLDQFVAGLLSASRLETSPGRTVRVQILNGNGEPEAGLGVANLLVPEGFRIADTGNASSFSFARTKIVVYRSEDLAVAQQIRKILGVGQIEVGRTRQTIVEVTVVVGRDFIARHQ